MRSERNKLQGMLVCNNDLTSIFYANIMTFFIATAVMIYIIGLGSISFYREEELQRKMKVAKERVPKRR